ncbi:MULTISPECIES: toxin VasX [Cupriavidus]
MSSTTLQAAKKQAAMNPRGASASGQCPHCVKKKGLAILPLVSGLLPNALLPASTIGTPISPRTDASLRSLSNALSAADLKHHWYYMRALPAGYLYVLLPDRTWQTYLVDRSGLLRAMPALDMPSPASTVEPMDQAGACSRPEHNPVGLQFIVLDPERTPAVWIAFSRYRWSREVLDNHRDDKDGCRALRMTQVNVQAAAKGELGRGRTVPNGHAMTAALDQHVADYASLETRQLIDRRSLEPLHPRGALAASAPLASSQPPAGKLAAQMADVSKNTPVKAGIFLVLSDVVGHAMQLNWYRNHLAAQICTVAGVGDADKARKRIVAECIEGIRRNAEQHPGPWYARHYGPERYLKHINQAAWQAALKEQTALTDLNRQITQVSEDFCTVIRSPRWQQQQRTDFSPDPASALSLETMVACCLSGSGQTPAEQEKLWDPVLDLPADDPDNWLTRAMGGLHKPFMDFLEKAPGDQGKAYDAAKNAEQLVSEFLGKGATQIEKIRAVVRARRAANVNTATLIETSAGHLFRLRSKNPKAYRKLIRQVTLALITRDDIVPMPTLMRGSWQQITQKWMSVLMGDPRATAQVPVGVTRGSTVGLSEIRRPALSGAVNGAVVLTPPGTREEAAATVAWVVKKIEQGGQLDYVLLRKLELTELRITAQSAARPTQANPVLENQLTRLGKQADAVLGAGSLFFQIVGGADVLNQFHAKRNPGMREYADLSVGLTYSVLGTIGAGIEMYVAVKVLGGASKESLVILMRRAAAIGASAGLIEGGYAIFKGGQKYSAGDKDSGYWSMGSGTFVAIASVASYGLMGATAAASAGVEAAGLAAAMGPVGWMLLLIAALGLALYCSWQAFATDDENLLPLEYWLDNGVFGKGAYRSGERALKNPYVQGTAVKPFSSLEEEVMALNKVVLVAQASFGSLQGSYATAASYRIDLPRYATGSRLEVRFYAYQKGQRVEIGELHCEDGRDHPSRYRLSDRLSGMRQAPTLLVDKVQGTAHIEGLFATANGSGGAIRDAVEWVVEAVSGKEVPDALYADSFGMVLKYWPDGKQLPDLVTEFTYPTPRK